MCIDSVMKHNFTFTPAISFFVTFETEQEMQSLSSKLSAGGLSLCRSAIMASAASSPWVTDRFGISWQLNSD